MNVNVTEIMREWTAIAGYPLVSCSTTQSGGSTQWTCTQSRFYSYAEPNPASTKWTIYLTGTTPASPSPFPIWWPATLSSPLLFSVPSSVPFVKLNTNTTGFFRVLYDAPSYAALSVALNQPGYSGLHHDDRLGLINDAFALAVLGRQSWPATLNLSLFLQHDISFPVWQVAYPSLNTVYNYLKYTNTTAKVLYVQYVQQAMTGVATHLSLNRSATPSAADAILETLLAVPMVRFNVGGRVSALQSIFVDLYDGLITVKDINPNLLDMVLEAGVMDGLYPNRWQWVYQTFYLAKLSSVNSTTSEDPLASPRLPSAHPRADVHAPRQRAAERAAGQRIRPHGHRSSAHHAGAAGHRGQRGRPAAVQPLATEQRQLRPSAGDGQQRRPHGAVGQRGAACSATTPTRRTSSR